MVENFLLNWLRSLAVCAALLIGTVSGSAQASEIGKSVENVATISFPSTDGTRISVLTNPATFVIEPQRTESTIEFFRYAPGQISAEHVQINGADCLLVGGTENNYVPMPPPVHTNGATINLSNPIPLAPASTYLAGEVVFVRVTDLGQNGDPDTIENIIVTITTSDGDAVTLRFYESGPDTGEFWAYIPSTRNATPVNDDELTTPSGTILTATYTDAYDATEVSVDTALVDPYGRVFSSSTGQLIDGARVTIIDAATGQPADVYGVDGMSEYPSSVISGQDTIDESGLVYPMRPGEFRFPLMAVGSYYVTVDAPDGYQFTSIFGPDDFVNLENTPFVVETDASYGERFTLDGTGPLNFDIPLDGESDLILTKTANQAFAGIGDYIGYSVSIENRGTQGMPILLQDTLPRGARYVTGSSKLDNTALSDPQISEDGQVLNYDLGALDTTKTFTLNYVVQIGANARPGEISNAIVALNNGGEPASNIARASVTIREDLLRSTSTIVGRISEKACDGDEDWAREINKGVGVDGVRLYMEDGSYAISDQDGLYHFEGVKKGTHVVQIDEETLPKGYEPMVCEESSRYAGRAISKFVDVKGGGIWRANFYLKQTGIVAKDEVKTGFNDVTEYKDYDAQWLNTQTPDVEWVYPSAARTPSSPSVNIGIKHSAGQTVDMSLNGHPVSLKNFQSRDSNKDRTVMMSRWRSVDILEGENTFVATIKDSNGRAVQTLKRKIYFVKTIARVTPLPDQSTLVADGRSKPELAFRLEDEAGHPVHAGRIATVDVAAPYRLYNAARLEGEEELVAPLSAISNITVGTNGIAHVVLEPTLQTGKVTVIVTMDDGRQVEEFMYLEPEKRDWIIVGLAEGSAAYNSLKNKMVALDNDAHDDLHTDGRVAFFAKGLIKGEWMLTLAVDTDKRRGNRDGDFYPEINPNAYYTLYGDRSYTAYEAVSRYPVYLKLEKKSFYAMFGDYDTNITEGKLTRYSRHLSGVKAEYLGERFQAMGFAAETNQGFAKDEIAAAGTSGPYYLSNTPVLLGSERITIETRDRTRPDEIIKTRTLVRHLDYTLDNISGELIFRLPVDVSDSGFNPNVIVADYETSDDVERNMSYGGRVQGEALRGKIKIGSTFAHEGGSTNIAGSKSDMIGADLIAQLTAGTQARLEYAMTTNKDSQNDRQTANAYLAEVVHTSEAFSGDVYLRQEEAGYGLGQRSSTTADIRRYGANADYKFDEFENEETGRRGSRNISGSLYKEENLGTGATRTLGEVTVNHDSEKLGLSAGLRQVKDDFPGVAARESLLALGSLRYHLPEHGATFEITHEQPLGGNNSVSDFPKHTRISVDKTVTNKATVRLAHDILHGDLHGGQNTSIGVDYAPWAGTSIVAGSDMITSDSGRRIGATIGVDQQFQLSQKWSAALGLSNRRILSSSGVIEQVAPDAAVSSFERNESFVAAYAGLGYRTDATSMTSRIEFRNSGKTESQVFSLAAARELSEVLSFAGAVRAQFRDEDDLTGGGNDNSTTRLNSRIGAAWRPRNEDMIVLNRFDVTYDDSVNGTRTTKLVNNLSANRQMQDRWQLSAQYGVKYVETTFGGDRYSGITQLFGAETRYDVTKRIDLGLHGSVLASDGFKSMQYAYGPSIGVSPVDNFWLSLGYNVVGYKERDFRAAEYSQEGPYIQFRMKFDQRSLRGMLDMISPSNR